jgi:hypothetical protein
VIYGDLSMNKGDLKQETIRNGDFTMIVMIVIYQWDFLAIS